MTTVDELVLGYLDLAERIAGRHAHWARHGVDLDDLVASAHVGLVKAARSWDPDRGVPFGAWAALRIRGAILDDLRAFAGSSVRQGRRRGVEVALPASLDAPGPDGDTAGDRLVDEARPVDVTVELLTAVRAGAEACEDQLDRDVLAALLGDGTMTEVAEAHGYTVPGVCWRAERLRTAMRRAAA